MNNLLKYFLVSVSLIVLGCSALETKQQLSADDQYGNESSHQTSNIYIKRVSDTANANKGQEVTEDAYIIVHPSYYVFFQKKPFILAPAETKNAVQTFLDMKFPQENTILNLMQLYEAEEMSFISETRTNGQLLILIIPGKYRKAASYLYKDTNDEYARYLNEAVLGAPTVFSMESIDTSSGKIEKEDMDNLVKMLRISGVKNIFVGGGYVGRCQEEFYRSLSKAWPENSIALIPELSAFSPADISDATARMLLTPDMQLNTLAANQFIKNGGIKTLGNKPNLRNISAPRPGLFAERNNGSTSTPQ